MGQQFRLDFPPEVEAQREQTFEKMFQLLREDTLEAVMEACRLQLDWLARYPDDYSMWEIGEMLGKSKDAILATEPQPLLAK